MNENGVPRNLVSLRGQVPDLVLPGETARAHDETCRLYKRRPDDIRGLRKDGKGQCKFKKSDEVASSFTSIVREAKGKKAGGKGCQLTVKKLVALLLAPELLEERADSDEA